MKTKYHLHQSLCSMLTKILIIVTLIALVTLLAVKGDKIEARMRAVTHQNTPEP